MESKKKPKGIYIASITPLKNGRIDENMLIQHLKQLEHDGVDGVLLMGTTGEGTSFSLEEKRRAIEIAVKNVGIVIMAGVGTPSLTDTIDATKQLLDAGASSALTLPPYYFKNVTDDGLFAYFKTLFDETLSGDDKGLLLYHIPQVTKIHLSHELLVRLSDYAGDKFWGIKDSSGDIEYSRKVVEELPHLRVLVGSDELLLESLNFGGSGCITAALNVLAPIGVNLYQAWKDGDEQASHHWQTVLTQGRDILANYQPYAVSLKALLAKCYENDGYSEVRAPLVENDPSQVRLITKQLQMVEGLKEIEWLF